MAAPPLGADCCLDYLSIIHQNIYCMPIDPDQGMMLKKILATYRRRVGCKPKSARPKHALQATYPSDF